MEKHMFKISEFNSITEYCPKKYPKLFVNSETVVINEN